MAPKDKKLTFYNGTDGEVTDTMGPFQVEEFTKGLKDKRTHTSATKDGILSSGT